MDYLNLPYGIRIAGSDPIDGDRYIADDIIMRDNLITIGRAKEGQQCYVLTTKTLYLLKGNTAADWVSIGGGGGGGSDANYVHNQDVSSAVWVINHNLSRYPTVNVFDSAHTQMEGEIKFLNINQVQLTFSVGVTGTAILN